MDNARVDEAFLSSDPRIREARALLQKIFPMTRHLNDMRAVQTIAEAFATLREENARLKERLGPRGLVVVKIGGTGHYVSEVVATYIARLREALKAFATEAKFYDPDEQDGKIIDDDYEVWGDCELSVGDLRRAREALGE